MSKDKQCAVTHPQISSGNCPWCVERLIDGQPAASDEQTDNEPLQWNLAAMSSALGDEDEKVRLFTVYNLGKLGPTLEDALPLLSKALGDSSSSIINGAEQILSQLGRDLATRPLNEIDELEKSLPLKKHEFAVRSLLLNCCLFCTADSPEVSEMCEQHTLWILNNAPASDAAGMTAMVASGKFGDGLYLRTRTLWLKQIKVFPNDSRVLGNAARFFKLRDKQRSEELLRRAKKLDPTNSIWSFQLAQLYSYRDPSLAYKELKTIAEAPRDGQTEEQLERFLAKDKHLLYLQTDLAKKAFASKNYEDASRISLTALKVAHSSKSDQENDRFDHGDLIYHCNQILGRCALIDGDVERAKEYLIASGKSKGSPSLCSFGPNMSLAKELLEHGEQQVVLEFFELCGQFWNSPENEELLQQWSNDIRNGNKPNFGPSLKH